MSQNELFTDYIGNVTIVKTSYDQHIRVSHCTDMSSKGECMDNDR